MVLKSVYKGLKWVNPKLITKGFEMYNILVRETMGSAPPLPMGITLEITYQCNARCKMCPFFGEDATSYPDEDAMCFDDLKRILHDIKAVYKKRHMPLPHIGVTGGEPFLRRFNELEAFKMKDGKIFRIEAVFTYVPYFMPSPFAKPNLEWQTR